VNSPCNGIARACAIEPRNAKNTNDVIDANFTRVTSFEANHRSLLTYTSGSSFIEGGRFSSPSAAGSASSAIEIRSLEERPVWLEEYAPMITLRFGFVPVPIGAALFLLAGCGGCSLRLATARRVKRYKPADHITERLISRASANRSRFRLT
jgi:hypothetical protein